MRTTLDLDDNVLIADKAHAAREKRSLGSVISELAREALQRPAALPARPVRAAAAALPCCPRASKSSPWNTCAA
jgi:hypothetical protein